MLYSLVITVTAAIIVPVIKVVIITIVVISIDHQRSRFQLKIVLIIVWVIPIILIIVRKIICLKDSITVTIIATISCKFSQYYKFLKCQNRSRHKVQLIIPIINPQNKLSNHHPFNHSLNHSLNLNPNLNIVIVIVTQYQYQSLTAPLFNNFHSNSNN